jgi:hypothetical protein
LEHPFRKSNLAYAETHLNEIDNLKSAISMSKESEAKFEALGDAVDRLITLDISVRGAINILYGAARSKYGKPLSYIAAKALRERVGPQKYVIIGTGLPVRGWISPAISETDGPTGAATLARALYVGFKAWPMILCEELILPVVKAACRGAGLMILSPEEMEKSKGSPLGVPGVVVQSFPYEKEKAEKEATRILDKFDPVTVISIERVGRNSKGIWHNMKGLDVTRAVAKFDYLFEDAKKRGIFTMGVGDGGNELGMGAIKEAIRKGIPYGAECQCPCKGGLAADFEPDLAMTSTVSGWASWGIEAVLAAMLGKIEVLHPGELEVRSLLAANAEGCIDGITGFVEPMEDSVPGQVCAGLIETLRFMAGKVISATGH